MNKHSQIIGLFLLFVAAVGCQTQTDQPPSSAAVSQQTAQTTVSTRDLVLLLGGMGGEERRVTVKVEESTQPFAGWPAPSKWCGTKYCSLSLDQLGSLPSGKVFFGPIPAGCLDAGEIQAKFQTSQGVMLMLGAGDSRPVLRWTEQ